MEAYSAHLAAAVTQALREADGARFAELLAYYRRRQGPGLPLALAEQAARQQRRLLNYPPPHPQPHGHQL